jgi:hypothetical protein
MGIPFHPINWDDSPPFGKPGSLPNRSKRGVFGCFPAFSRIGTQLVSDLANPAGVAGNGFSREALMSSNFIRVAAAAFCSLMLTTVAVGAAVDGHAASRTAAVVYASAGTADSAHG